MSFSSQTHSQKFLLILFIFAVINLQATGQVTAEKIPLPASIPEQNELRFAVIGDSGTGSDEQYEVARQMLQIHSKTNFSLLLFLGDNIYESGSPKDVEKKFLKPYAPFVQRGVELRGAIGNHDARSEYGVILQQLIFNMGSRTFYSFTKQNNLVEFFAIDSTIFAREKNSAKSNGQIEWFEKNAAQSKALWKIAFMHHPLYSSAKKHGFESSDADELLNVRQALEPIYVKYGIQISLNGHDHVYERTKPQNDVQYFTSGAGAKLREDNLQKDSPFYAFGNDQVRSFMLFSVKPEITTFWSIDNNGNILDSGLIYRTKIK